MYQNKKITSNKNTNAAIIAAQERTGKSATVLADNRPASLIQKKKVHARVKNQLNRDVIQTKQNKTGLPDNLKLGIENISGHSMDDVKVHYNSSQPAQLNAHAYAQGTEIHIAPGQEKHLPHEAWHVVQQKQGRVKPTMQLKGKVNVNDDKGLEKEADVMGNLALQRKAAKSLVPAKNVRRINSTALQMLKGDPGDPHRVDEKTSLTLEAPVADQHIVVPNVSGCAAIKINVYSGIDAEKVLVRSIVLHSDATKDSTAEAQQIANQIIHLQQPDKSVTVLVLTNGKYKSYGEHLNKVIAPFAAEFKQHHIDCTLNHRELLYGVRDAIDINLTGSDYDIITRYEELLPRPEEREERIDEYQRYMRLLAERNRSGRSAKKVRRGRAMKNNPNYVQAIPLENFRRLRPNEQRAQADGLQQRLARRNASCCYITTACVEHMGLSDNCEALTILRHFRDTYLVNKSNGKQLVQLYYNHSPSIVTEIKKRKNHHEILSRLYVVIKKCVEAIKAGDNEFAFNMYYEMVNKLKEEFIPETKIEIPG